MGYTFICNGQELYHHGIKGQRWGVRRFQNPDGTLTDAGRKKYYSAMNVKKAYGITDRRKAVLNLKSAGRYAAATVGTVGAAGVAIATESPLAVAAYPTTFLIGFSWASIKDSEDKSEYAKKYLNGGFSDTKTVDDLSKIAPIRRNELSIAKGTEFTRVSTKEQEDGKNRLYACLSADNKEIDYYSNVWPSYLKRIKNDPIRSGSMIF